MTEYRLDASGKKRPRSAVADMVDKDAQYITTPNGLKGQIIARKGDVITVRLETGTIKKYKVKKK